VPRSPDSVARDLRTIAEAVVTKLYAETIGDPQARGAAQMIERLGEAGIITKKHTAFLHTVRSVGNIAVHPQAQAGVLEPKFNPEEVLAVADFLISVLKWYLARSSVSGHVRVAISGSAQPGCGDWSMFCLELGRALARDGYYILCTSAEGVGRPFYEGALEHLTSTEDPEIHGKCIGIRTWARDPEQVRKNRESLLKGIDACVFVSGGQGAREEYEILSRRQVFCIPIGASGGTARAVWQQWRDTLPQGPEASRGSPVLRLGQEGLEITDYVSAVREILAGQFRRRETAPP
jgi:hypothetical protein